MTDFPFGDSVTVITRSKSGTDAYGDDVFTEASVTVVGAFDPGGSAESTQGGDTVVSQPQVFLPYGTAVTATSVLLVGGLRYQADGEPRSWSSPFTGWQPGVAVPLRRVTG